MVLRVTLLYKQLVIKHHKLHIRQKFLSKTRKVVFVLSD